MNKPSTVEPAGLSASGKPLSTKEKPFGGIHVSKRAVLLLAVPVALAGGVVIYNIFARSDSTPSTLSEKSSHVESAMDVADSINQKAEHPVFTSDLGNPPSLPARNEPATKIESPPKLPRHDEADHRPTKQLTPSELAAQRLAEERLQRLQQAMDAATNTRSFHDGGTTGQELVTNPRGMAGNIAGGMTAGGALVPASLMGSGMDKDDPNGQKDKQSFLKSAQTQLATPLLPASLESAVSPYEINSGTVIPAVLLTGLNSDLPGEIIGQVSENVFDTATGNHLLIPQGAKLFGVYDSRVSYGQNRLLVAWQRIIFPNGSTLEIGGMGGVDKTGGAGFEDQVDNHYWRLFTGALLTSIFSAGIQLSQPQNSGSLNSAPNMGQTIGSAVGQQIGQLGVSISQKNLAIQPTIVIRQGYRFHVMVDKDAVFPGDYR